MPYLTRRPLAFLSLSLLVGGCATNPATGRRQLSLVSEGQEIALGKQNDQQITGALGLYDDPALQSYVHGLGLALAKTSERPSLPWTFRVVDDPVVNAFALPGGYIYVTRGILAHLGSEAELAGVVGHEIGHVTGRHGVDQMSKAQLANLGLGIGMILKPELKTIGDVASTGLGLLFLKYGRDDEREADHLGLRYMERAHYDPRPMTEVFTLLERVSLAAGGGGRVPDWLSTHPDPVDRRERVAAEIATHGSDFPGTKVERDSYLRRLDGLVFGEDPREGFFDGALFHHPGMRFRLRFPDGFVVSNRKDAVSGMSAAKDAMVRLSLAAAASAEAAARALLAEPGVAGRSRRERVNGFSAVAVEFETQDAQSNVLRGEVVFVDYDGKVFELLGIAPTDRWRSYERVISASLRSFDEERDRDVLAVQPMRLKIVEVGRDTPAVRFAASYSGPVPVETLYLINGVDENATLRRGTLWKRVVGESLR